jgi:hypothetical protein
MDNADISTENAGKIRWFGDNGHIHSYAEWLEWLEDIQRNAFIIYVRAYTYIYNMI